MAERTVERACPHCGGTGTVPPLRQNAVKNYRRRVDRKQDATRPVAHQHRQPWTEQELSLVCDLTLTRDELALRLGRTWAAIKAKRRDLRADGTLPKGRKTTP